MKLTVFLQNTDFVKALEHEIEALRENIAAEKKRFQSLETKYANLQTVNMELTDLCRYHGIKFRPGVDLKTWDKQ